MIGGLLKAQGRMKLVFCGIALGALLIIVGIFASDGGTAASSGKVVDTNIISETERLEKRLSELLRKISGAGEVSVMIFASDDGKSEYAADTSGTSSENVVLGSSSSEHLEEVRRISPDIVGVAVVCPGSGENLRAEITMLVSALFGISASKVYVSG